MEFDISKRRFCRYSCEIGVEFDENLLAFTQDISLGGICIECPQTFEINKIVKFKMHLEKNDNISPIGKIRWSKEIDSGFLIGIEFWELTYRDKLLLKSKIKKLNLQQEMQNISHHSMSEMDHKVREVESFLSEVDFFIQEAENDVLKMEAMESIDDTAKNPDKINDTEQMFIRISEDKLLVTADFYPSADQKILSDNEIYELIALNNIKSKIIWENINTALEKVSKTNKTISNVIISAGEKPIEQIPQYIKIKPALLEKNNIPKNTDEVIDYHEISPYKSVVKGEEVAMIIPEQAGKNGKDVEGNDIPFHTKKVENLKIGKNLAINDKSILSTCHGNFHVESNEIFVNECLHIKGDIDYSTGNIKFLGDIVVEGGVREGFKVICGGSMLCKKTIEVSDIFIQNDLVCQSGIIGRKDPLLRVGGSIHGKFIEKCKIECRKEIVVEKSIVNSQIYTLDKVITGSTGRLQNCEIIAQNGVKCGQIGSTGGSETQIMLGVNFIINKRILMIKNKSEKLISIIENIEKKRDNETRKIIDLKNKIFKGLSNLEELVEHLLRQLHTNENACLQVDGRVYPVLTVSVCHVTEQYTSELPGSEFTLNKLKGCIERH
ncbi:MAG: DUF342 domain-containing protein [Spirochaetales bacterium]|nr:DUF342 domain-containing protein [Spirochaetales bacterium]